MALFDDFLDDINIPQSDLIDQLLDMLLDLKAAMTNAGNQTSEVFRTNLKFDLFKDLSEEIVDAIRLNGPQQVQEAVMQRLAGGNNSLLNNAIRNVLSTGPLRAECIRFTREGHNQLQQAIRDALIRTGIPDPEDELKRRQNERSRQAILQLTNLSFTRIEDNVRVSWDDPNDPAIGKMLYNVFVDNAFYDRVDTTEIDIKGLIATQDSLISVSAELLSTVGNRSTRATLVVRAFNFDTLANPSGLIIDEGDEKFRVTYNRSITPGVLGHNLVLNDLQPATRKVTIGDLEFFTVTGLPNNVAIPLRLSAFSDTDESAGITGSATPAAFVLLSSSFSRVVVVPDDGATGTLGYNQDFPSLSQIFVVLTTLAGAQILGPPDVSLVNSKTFTFTFIPPDATHGDPALWSVSVLAFNKLGDPKSDVFPLTGI